MRERKIAKKFASFRERVGGNSERQIAGVITNFFEYLNSRNGDALLELFSPDASIESKMGSMGTMTPRQYISSVKSSNFDFVLFSDGYILIDGEFAIVNGYVSIHMKSGPIHSHPYTFRLSREGVWKISSGSY